MLYKRAVLELHTFRISGIPPGIIDHLGIQYLMKNNNGYFLYENTQLINFKYSIRYINRTRYYGKVCPLMAKKYYIGGKNIKSCRKYSYICKENILTEGLNY